MIKSNLITQQFGLLTVIERISNTDNKHVWYNCLCRCGSYKLVRADALTGQFNKSCGCLKKSKEKNLTGQRSGRLIFLKKNKISTNGRKLWICQCDCGKTINLPISAFDNIKSCGCLNKERFLPTHKKCKNNNCQIKSINEFKIRKRIRKNGYIGHSADQYCKECAKLRKRISNSILIALKENKNNLSCFKFLSYSLDDLKQHIESNFESWMSWNNWGKYNPQTWNDEDINTWTWNIDHITPHSTFKYTSMKDKSFKQCWALNNLRPYSAKQNILDGARREK